MSPPGGRGHRLCEHDYLYSNITLAVAVESLVPTTTISNVHFSPLSNWSYKSAPIPSIPSSEMGSMAIARLTPKKNGDLFIL